MSNNLGLRTPGLHAFPSRFGISLEGLNFGGGGNILWDIVESGAHLASKGPRIIDIVERLLSGNLSLK